jgi:hypothetical protein
MIGILLVFNSFFNLYSPEIALHKKSNTMKEIKEKYVKRTQKNYSISFKLVGSIIN